MKIAIINDVHIGKPLERNRILRAASPLVESALPQILKQIEKQHVPDLLVNLGDLIRSENKERDQERYSSALAPFKNVACEVLHMLGNHELKQMEVHDVERLWQEKGYFQKSYGLKDLGSASLLWLGMEYTPERGYKHRLPDEQLQWLEEVVSSIDKPLIVFSHCALDDQDVYGNYFYEGYEVKDKRAFFLENYEKIQAILATCPWVEIIIQAHLHYFHTKMINGVPYVTCPALGDNICAPSHANHIPEIYSLLTLSPKHLTLKAFSREYCFAGAEFSRTNRDLRKEQ